jgi:DNA-directed RNA polymerase subunit omega
MKIRQIMQKRTGFESGQIMERADELMEAASNRYRITVQVAKRAKRRREEEMDHDEQLMKPVIRAIIEMSDELTQPEIIGE